jgi:hypothetical protein
MTGHVPVHRLRQAFNYRQSQAGRGFRPQHPKTGHQSAPPRRIILPERLRWNMTVHPILQAPAKPSEPDTVWTISAALDAYCGLVHTMGIASSSRASAPETNRKTALRPEPQRRLCVSKS